MAFLFISLAIVSLAKGAGAFALLAIANRLFHTALEFGGWFLLLYPVALYLVGLSCICLYDSADEFMSILSELFDDNGDDIEY